MVKRTDLSANDRHHASRSVRPEPILATVLPPEPLVSFFPSGCTVNRFLQSYGTNHTYQTKFTSATQTILMQEHNYILDYGYPTSFLTRDECFVRLPLLSSDILLSSIRRFQESIPKGSRTKIGYINLIQNDFSRQTTRLIQSSTPEPVIQRFGFR